MVRRKNSKDSKNNKISKNSVKTSKKCSNIQCSNSKTQLLSHRISQFVAEVGDKELTEEQAKIFHAFTKVNGSKIYFQVEDCENVMLRICVSKSEKNKILLKHYCTNIGTITANDILEMFDIIRKGEKNFNNGNYVYSISKRKKGVTYKVVVKIFSNGKDAVLKSFHSTIGYENRKIKKASNVPVTIAKKTKTASSKSLCKGKKNKYQ